MLNVMDMELEHLTTETFGWACLPMRILTEKHIRLLRGDVTGPAGLENAAREVNTPSVVEMGESVLQVRDQVLPRFFGHTEHRAAWCERHHAFPK